MKHYRRKILFYRFVQDRPVHFFIAGMFFCAGVVGLVLSLV